MAELSWLQRAMIGSADRREFYLALSEATRDGLRPFDILSEMGPEFEAVRNPLAPAVREIMRRLRGGGGKRGSSPTVAATFYGIFPSDEVVLIEAGETAKTLSDGLAEAASYLTKMDEIRSAATKPLMEPALLLTVLFGIIYYLSVEVLPMYGTIVPRTAWPAYAKLYGKLADNVVWLVGGLSVAIIALAALFVWSSKNWTGSGRAFADRWVPGFGMYGRIASASLLTSLASFISAGQQISAALDRMAGGSSPFVRSLLAGCKSDLAKGRSVDQMITGISVLPRSFHWRVKVYAKTGRFDQALGKISAKLVEETITRLQLIFRNISLVLKLCVGAFFLWSMLSFFGIAFSAKKHATKQVASAPTFVAHPIGPAYSKET